MIECCSAFGAAKLPERNQRQGAGLKNVKAMTDAPQRLAGKFALFQENIFCKTKLYYLRARFSKTAEKGLLMGNGKFV